MSVFIQPADYVETLIKLPPTTPSHRFSEEEKIRSGFTPSTIISITFMLFPSLSPSLYLSHLIYIGIEVYVYYITVEGQRGDNKSDEFAASLGLLKFLICQLVSRARCALLQQRATNSGWGRLYYSSGDGGIYCLLKGVLCSCYTAVKYMGGGYKVKIG